MVKGSREMIFDGEWKRERRERHVAKGRGEGKRLVVANGKRDISERDK